MKKWIVLYLILGIAAFALAAGIRAADLRGMAEAGPAVIGDEISCQAVNAGGAGFLLVRDGERWKALRVDGGQDYYQILGTVCPDSVYYQYRYRNAGESWRYGIGMYDRETKSIQSLREQMLGGFDWMAFGTNTEGLTFAMADTQRLTIQEYVLKVPDASDGFLSRQAIEAPEGRHISQAAYKDGNLYVCMEDGSAYCYRGGTAEICTEDSDTPFGKGQRNEIKKEAANAWKWESIRYEAGRLAVPFLAGYLLFGLVLFGALGKDSLIRRMFWLSEGVLAAVVIAGGIFFGVQAVERQYEEAAGRAEIYLTGLYDKKLADGSIPYEDIRNAAEKSGSLFVDILLTDGAAVPASVISSVRLPRSAAVSDYYGNEMEKLIEEAGAGMKTTAGEIILGGYRNPAVALRDPRELSGAPILSGILSGREIALSAREEVAAIVRAMWILFAAGTVIAGLAFLVYTMRWRRFTGAITSVAKKKEAVRISERETKGLSGPWRALGEIGRSMEELNYEKRQNFNAYYRFAPRKIEKLLGKRELSEVAAGDMAEVDGSMAVMSLESRDRPDGRLYMETVTRSFEIANRILAGKSGVLISHDADFTKMKILFPDRVSDAVEFAIETVQAYARDPLLAGKEKMFLIHTSAYLYGVSGTEEQALPFVYSGDESLLGPYVEPLRRAGAELVLTDHAVKELGDRYTLRYIGFITEAETARSIKLYECPEAYPAQRRRLMAETDQVFRKALELFYSNDFYLARNAFNAVLKVDPEDRIARWYLFNCEYHLNASSDAPVAYGLFENRMLEQQYRIGAV